MCLLYVTAHPYSARGEPKPLVPRTACWHSVPNPSHSVLQMAKGHQQDDVLLLTRGHLGLPAHQSLPMVEELPFP